MKRVAAVTWRDTVELSASIKTGRITTKYVAADRQIRRLRLTRTYLYVRPAVHVPEHLLQRHRPRTRQSEPAKLAPKSDDLPDPVIDFSANAFQVESARNKAVDTLVHENNAA